MNGGWFARFGRHGDVALVSLVIAILAMLFTPLVPGLLDFLILSNFSFALLLLLLTFYVQRPVEFSTFPSLLLIATLFRLALNVSATRLILTEGNAGEVIGAVGTHVVSGNYVVGFIVFVILVVVQYVVVTSGAQRVSEVAARFTLDSMPGQQMSIDADLNMGFIDQAEAMRRRKLLEKESSFYGAMDGASKFVKGDAIAGIVILLINIVGGLIIGVMQLGMAWGEALQRFTLLTIGDGIVTQVPALVIAVGTGIIVTRSGGDRALSREVFAQISASPKALGMVAVALLALTAMPGIPVWPPLVLGGILAAAMASTLRKNSESDASEDSDKGNPPTATEEVALPPRLEPVEVQIGTGLLPITQTPALSARLAAFRSQFATDWGMTLPALHLRGNGKMASGAYQVLLHGVSVARGELMVDRVLAIHPTGDTRSMPGIATREPTYGLPAIWIEEKHRAAAQAAKFTLVEPDAVLMTHLTEVLQREAPTLLTRGDTDRLLGELRRIQPGLVEEVIPTLLSIGDVQKVLQSLLKEKVSIRNLEAIMETLADAARATKALPLLAESVRQRLGAAICQSLAGDSGSLNVMTLDAALEHRLSESARQSETGKGVPLEPKLAEQLVARLSAATERMMKSNHLPVLLCAPELRRPVRSLVERAVPHLRVLSLVEVPNAVSLKSFAVVSIQSTP